MAQVVVEMSSDEAKLFRGMQRVVGQQKRMEDGFKKTGRQSRETFGNQATSMLKRFGAGLVGAGGVLAGLRLISDELENIKRRQSEAFAAQTTAASARRDLIRNLPGVAPADRRAFLGQANTLAQRTSVEQRFIDQALASAVSALGGDRQRSLAAVRTSARFLSDKPGEIGDFAGSLGDIAQLTGFDNMQANLGLLQFVAGQSRIVKPRQQAMNIPRALIGMRQLGFDPSSAAAVFSALTVGAGDITGESSGTAGIALAEQMRQFFADRGQNLAGLPALRRLQQTPALGQQFLADASFEKKFIGPIESLITQPDSAIARQVQANLTKFPDSREALAAVGRQALEAQTAGKLQQTAEAGRVMASTVNRIQLADAEEGVAGAVRKGIAAVKDALPDSRLSKRFDLAKFELSSVAGQRRAIDAAQAILAREADRQRFIELPTSMQAAFERRTGADRPVRLMRSGELVPATRSGFETRDPVRLERAEALENAIRRLESIEQRLAEDSRRTADAAERSARANEQMANESRQRPAAVNVNREE